MPNVFPDDILRRLRELEKRVAGTISLWGAVANAQFTNEGDPNGLVSGAVGDVLVDTATPELWQNIDGATGWLPFPHYWGSAETAQFGFGGDPNGIISAESVGDLLVDGSTPALWQSTDGLTAWKLIGNSFPIIEDDGTVTASIDLTSHNLKTQLMTDAGSVLQSSIELDNNAGISLENYSGHGIFFTVNDGGGHNGIYFEITGSNDQSFSVTDFDAHGIFLTSIARTGQGGVIHIDATDIAGSVGKVQLSAGQIELAGTEVLFPKCLAAPTSADLVNGAFGFWWDDTTHVLSIKARDSGGTLRNLTIGTLT